MSAESVGKAALSWTVSLATLNVPLKLGMVSVEFERAGDGGRGRGGDRLADAVRGEVLRPGDRAGRAHDLEHLAGVNVLTCMGRSNVTLNELFVPLMIRLSVPLELRAPRRSLGRARARSAAGCSG